MKYMGSKTALLRGELGELLLSQTEESTRFVDLFAGAGSVAHFIAENTPLPVLSADLQHYSRYLVGCVTERVLPMDPAKVIKSWISPVGKSLASDCEFLRLSEPIHHLSSLSVARSRASSAQSAPDNFITRHYGGHYFSAQQAYILDRLYSSLPEEPTERALGMAALVHTASVCAAAPGHTAQPFQPTEKLLPHIKASWSRDVIVECQRQVEALAPRHAQVEGEARVGEATNIAEGLGEGDLVFCDPPYSAVQYSRFYHVLEGISRGGWADVTGAGRAPARYLRASSEFSMISQASKAMKSLLDILRAKSCRVIVTFPDAAASNGLSGKDIVALAAENWHVTETYVDSIHSTLGGSSNSGGRGGRRNLQEAVLLLEPKLHRQLLGINAEEAALLTADSYARLMGHDFQMAPG